MNQNIIILEEVDSTNTWLADNVAELASGVAVMARAQSAGRGQRGTSWESAPGKNLTLSLLLKPEGVPAAKSFILSEAVAVAVAETVEAIVPDVNVSIKWPNDIYVGDLKLGGVLIENSLFASDIDHSIVGLGLNINQEKFLSDAPNPISLFQITEQEYSVDEFADQVVEAMNREASKAVAEYDDLHMRYMSRLWRGTGTHRFTDVATGESFSAAVAAVEPTGYVQLLTTDRRTLSYAFKEVTWDL